MPWRETSVLRACFWASNSGFSLLLRLNRETEPMLICAETARHKGAWSLPETDASWQASDGLRPKKRPVPGLCARPVQAETSAGGGWRTECDSNPIYGLGPTTLGTSPLIPAAKRARDKIAQKQGRCCFPTPSVRFRTECKCSPFLEKKRRKVSRLGGGAVSLIATCLRSAEPFPSLKPQAITDRHSANAAERRAW